MSRAFSVFQLILLTSYVGGVLAQDPHPIMRPDRETKKKWIESYKRAPRVHSDRLLMGILSSSVNLLGHLQYSPSERDQLYCGNCWAWAGTGCMEIALDVQESIKDRLSVQYINSCESSVIGKSCCDGGWLYDIAQFYAATGKAIPWSNSGASWQDGDASCNTSCGSISQAPYYPISSVTAETIATQGVGQASAINNIKTVLDQGRAVWFGFFLSNTADWNAFFNFWDYSAESVLFDFDYACNKPWNYGGGHAVLCVGYNDENPANHYWIMLNSWGTTAGRPNGIFRVSMDIDYGCADTTPDYNLYWQALNISFSSTPTATPTSTPPYGPTLTPTSTPPYAPTPTPTPTVPYVPPVPPTATPTYAPPVLPTVAPTATVTPPADLTVNSPSLSGGEYLSVTFSLNESIERRFTVFAVLILPDGSMLNVTTLDTPLRPNASDYPGLQAPFEYPLIALNVPPGAPVGNYELLVAFFDSLHPIRSRADAFLQVSRPFIVGH